MVSNSAARIPSLHRQTLLASFGMLLVLGACDQQPERLQRAQDIADAVVDQVLGAPPQGPMDTLESVPLDARAMAGTLRTLPTEAVSPPAARRYFVGSIVAKPRDLAPAIAMADVTAEPSLVDDVVINEFAEAKIVILDEATTAEAEANPAVIETIENAANKARSVTVIDPRAIASTRSLYSKDAMLPRKRLDDEIFRKKQAIQGMEAPAEYRMMAPEPTREERIAAMPVLKPELAERAIALRRDTLDKQLNAENRMIEAATKFGIATSIQRSRSGQMVIEIGADALNPTQFSGEAVSRLTFAVDNEMGCDIGSVEGNLGMAMECVIEDLKSSGDFEYVEKDYLFDHQMIRRPGTTGPAAPVMVMPNDPLFAMQWNFRKQGAAAGQSPGGAGFVDFWTSEGSQGSSDVVVAVIDTGLELSHPDIATSPNLMPGWDMVSDPLTGNDGDGRDSDPDDPGDLCPERGILANSYHGTHVAGTIGAGISNNRVGVAGGAWNVKIVPVRALGKCGGRLSDINDAIRWAAGTIPEYDVLGNEIWNENPADIINLSIGLFKTCPASMQDAIDAVSAAGVIVVAAAGNDRISTEYYAPAGCRNVVTVAAGDARGVLAPYSNYGADVDILAPGGDLSRDDDADGNPDGVLSTKSAENCFDPVSRSSVAQCHYAYEQGTSMAAPHVSAALALIKSKRPELTASELVSRLTDGLTSLSSQQCTGLCSQYPGAEPTAEDPALCARPCGAGLLNLAGIDLTR